MMLKNLIKYSTVLIIMPLIVIAGVLIGEKSWAIVSFAIAALTFVPVFISFEQRREKDEAGYRGRVRASRQLTVIAVMTALSVVGRIVFYIIPFFKPVTAIVIITAVYFGSEAGFMTGAMSALVSNIYFGQGAWTPFQMLTWGFIGLIAGLLGRPFIRRKYLMIIYGIISGAVFSVVMDTWSVLEFYHGFSIGMYLTIIASSLPVMLEYMVSNGIFLAVFINPIGKKLNRIKIKFGI